MIVRRLSRLASPTCYSSNVLDYNSYVSYPTSGEYQIGGNCFCVAKLWLKWNILRDKLPLSEQQFCLNPVLKNDTYYDSYARQCFA